MIIYGCGYERTFGIGAMFPAGLFCFSPLFARADVRAGPWTWRCG